MAILPRLEIICRDTLLVLQIELDPPVLLLLIHTHQIENCPASLTSAGVRKSFEARVGGKGDAANVMDTELSEYNSFANCIITR